MSMFKNLINKLVKCYESESLDTKIVTDVSLMVYPFIEKNILDIDSGLNTWISKKIKAEFLNSIHNIIVQIYTYEDIIQYKCVSIVEKDNKVHKIENKYKPISRDSIDKNILSEIDEQGVCILVFK
jgi:hypothetical protein